MTCHGTGTPDVDTLAVAAYNVHYYNVGNCTSSVVTLTGFISRLVQALVTSSMRPFLWCPRQSLASSRGALDSAAGLVQQCHLQSLCVQSAWPSCETQLSSRQAKRKSGC